ncbi:hypothetical protein Tco_0960517, partial [Tanacetum coccineum]
SQQTATRNKGNAIVNSSAPTYDQEHDMVADDDEMSKEKEIDKLMVLIFLSFKKIYKPTNNNPKISSNTSRDNQNNSPRINKGSGYEKQRVVNVAGPRENVGTQQENVRNQNLGIKSFLKLFGVTAALIDVNATQSNTKLLLLEEVTTASGINAIEGVNAASEEVSTA